MDDSISDSPIPDAASTTENLPFTTAHGSSFFIGDSQGDISSSSYNTDCQSKDGLAGSYCYASIGVSPGELQAPPAGRSTPNGGFLLR